MTKREMYEQRTEEILAPIIEEHEFELVDVEYVKEGGTWYLRAYIDKPGGITIDDCETVSRRLSDILDEKDYIEDAYIMEEVELRTYRMIEKRKEFTGILRSYDEKTVTIEEEEGGMRTFEKSDIALIRLAFDF